MAYESHLVSMEEIALKNTRAFAMGPFGSNIRAENYCASGVPVIRGTNLSNIGGPPFVDSGFVYLTEEKAEQLSSSDALPGDIVFVAQGTVGKLGLIPMDCRYRRFILSQNLMRLRVDEAIADRRYVYYFFRSRMGQEEILSRVSPTGVPCISQPLSSLRRFRMPYRNLADQRSIADLLELLDRRMLTAKATNVTLENIAKVTFKSWFVDFDPVRAKAEGREPEGMDADTAALFPSEFKKLPIGPFPLSWTKVSLGDISNVGIGKTPPRAQHQWFSESDRDVVWVSIKDMGKAGVYISTSSEFLTQEAVKRFNLRVVPDNTVIVSFKLTVGRLAITDGRMTTNEAIAHCVLSDDASVSTEYLYCALAAFDFTSLASTSSIAEAVNSKTIRGLNITVPTRVLMDRFTEVVQPLFQKIKNNQRSIETLSELRDTLLPRLISGKLRISEAEKLVEAVA